MISNTMLKNVETFIVNNSKRTYFSVEMLAL